MAGLVPKSDFVGLDGVAHLAAGGETPFLRSHVEALERFCQAKSQGMRGRDAHHEIYHEAKQRAARLLGCHPDDIAFTAHVSEAANLIAHSLEWRAGDNVVLEALEFPSDLYPWLLQSNRGVEVRALEPRLPSGEPGGWSVPLDAFREAIDGRTRVVVISHVSYLTGERHDLEALSALARAAGSLFVVDASHSLGVVPVRAPLADFVLSCSYKWLLGAHGTAVAYWNRQRLPDWQPRAAGHYSVVWKPPAERGGYELRPDAGRMELGNPAFASIYVLHNALGYLLSVGVERIEHHVLALGARLRAGLEALGLELVTPAEPSRRAGNICLASARAQEWQQVLAEGGVEVWEADNRLRLSVHLYNDLEDVERGLAALGALV